MYEELDNLDDKTLLQRYVGDPNSLEGKGTDAVLRYRQYLALKDYNLRLVNYNRRLVLVTVVLALWGGIQAITTGVQAWAAWKNVKATERTLSENVSNKNAGEAPLTNAQIKELKERLDRLESKLKDK